MLNRRFLRIKVMQSLYSFFQHEKGNVAAFEKEMFKSLDKIVELNLYIFALLIDIQHVASVITDENKHKRLPTDSDLNPNLKFINNALLVSLSTNKELLELIEKRKISWQNDMDVIRKLFLDIRSGESYTNYIASKTSSIKEDTDYVISIIEEYLIENDVLISILEEKNIHWADDTFVAFNSIMRNIEGFDGTFKLLPLLKDEKDDMEFMSHLFTKTIMYKPDYVSLIDKHTKNWEVDRIANMDMLLMEMALTEILYIPKVPVKASLNEYIDISKEYSTPQSKTFVNGVLDKIIAELRDAGKITKEGRGLKEN
jgi:transcription antitermination protein NusB